MDTQIIAAVIGATGVIIGVLITSIITGISDAIKYNREEEIYYKRKREETYLEMLENIDAVHNYIISKSFQLEDNMDIKGTTNNLRAKANLYVKKQIADTYYRLMSNLYEDNHGKNGFTFAKWDKLVSDIRNDLNIKD